MYVLAIIYYIVTNRGEGNVRHCRIVKEGNQYVIGSAAFDSLSEIVEYYKANPLYRGIKLKYAANDEVVKSMTEVSLRFKWNVHMQWVPLLKQQYYDSKILIHFHGHFIDMNNLSSLPRANRYIYLGVSA